VSDERPNYTLRAIQVLAPCPPALISVPAELVNRRQVLGQAAGLSAVLAVLGGAERSGAATTAQLPRAHAGAISALAVSGAGRTLASAASGEPGFKTWDLSAAAPQPKRQMSSPGDISCLAFSPDGRLAIGWSSGRIEVRPAPYSTPGKYIVAHSGKAVSAMVFPTYGKLLISAGGDGAICFWNMNSAAPERVSVSTVPLTALAVSSGGQYLAAAFGSTAKIWLLSGTQLTALKEYGPRDGHTGSISNLMFLDETLIGIAGERGELQLRTVPGFSPAGDLHAHSGSVNGLTRAGAGNQPCVAAINDTS